MFWHDSCFSSVDSLTLRTVHIMASPVSSMEKDKFLTFNSNFKIIVIHS